MSGKYGKILIECTLTVLSGLHIGAAGGFSAIGAVDSVVIRDPMTDYPIVPGSSLKGKLRTLLVREMAEDATNLPECKDDIPQIKRLFGSTAKASLLQFTDCPLLNANEMRKVGFTSIKAENCIGRQTGKAANPRFIERVNPGCRFYVRIVYDAYEGIESQETKRDLSMLALAMERLQWDHLGGHCSRGSGQISLDEFKISTFSDKNADLTALKAIFQSVESYHPFIDIFAETKREGSAE